MRASEEVASAVNVRGVLKMSWTPALLGSILGALPYASLPWGLISTTVTPLNLIEVVGLVLRPDEAVGYVGNHSRAIRECPRQLG